MPAIYRNDALAQSDETTATIGTAHLRLTVRRLPDGALALAGLTVAGQDWSPPTPSGLLALDTTPGQPLAGGQVHLDQTPATVTLTLTGRLPDQPLQATLIWQAYPETGALTVETRLTALAPTTIQNPQALWLALQPPAGTRLATLRGGAYDDRLPPSAYTLTLADLTGPGSRPRRTIAVGPDGRASTDYLPWAVLLGPTGGLLTMLAWSGRWHLTTQTTPAGTTLTTGPTDLTVHLAPGQTLTLPTVLLLGFAGDLDDAGFALHTWQERHWCPPTPPDWPWVQYNHWYAYHGDIDAQRLWAEAEIAATVGCEVFVIDDGWFRGRRPDSYVQGWGDWVEDRTKFPEGLRAFGQALRQRGLRFGLWVEPERVDPNGPLARAHPDWLARRQGQVISRQWGGETGAHLCLGVPAVQEWMAETLIRLVRDYGLDWLKWDYNMGYGPGCDHPDHGHQAGDGAYAHTLGLYRVLDALRQACPDLVIENCASAGHRVDLGLLRYTHTQWLSDYTHRPASCRHHAQGAWYALPTAYLNTWLLETPDPAASRSRMGGAFGVSARLSAWTPEQRAALARAIAEYKRLRPLLRGRRFVLGSLWHSGWDLWQFHDPLTDRGALLAFRAAAALPGVQVRLRGLRPDRPYRLEPADGGPVHETTGQTAMTEGISLTLPTVHQSALLWIQPL